MGRGNVLAVAVLLTTALAACGDQAGPGAGPAVPAASPTAPLPADGPVRAVATVLDDGDGPELCLGGIADSLPPQCGGPDVTGWDWADQPVTMGAVPPDHSGAGLQQMAWITTSPASGAAT